MTTPDSALTIDTDNLAPTHYLILEVLAARYRLGEALWTFPSRPAIVVALDKLAELDLVGWKGGVAPKTVRAWLTNTGRREALSETYVPPAAPCGCPITVEQMRMCRHTNECVTRGQADRLSAAIEEYDRG